MKSDDEAVRKRARRAFCGMTPADKKSVPELIQALNSGDEVFRYWATRGLSGIGPEAKSAVPALIQALSTDDSDFRFWVVTALSSIGAEARDALPRLLELLRDPVFGVRQAVADALVQIAPEAPPVAPALSEALEEDDNEFVREEVIRAIGRVGTPPAVTALVAALTDRNREVSRWAAIGLKMLGPKAAFARPEVQQALATISDAIIRGDLEIALSRMEA